MQGVRAGAGRRQGVHPSQNFIYILIKQPVKNAEQATSLKQGKTGAGRAVWAVCVKKLIHIYARAKNRAGMVLNKAPYTRHRGGVECRSAGTKKWGKAKTF